jgi:peptidoglycan hydrolase-like protein with peptidoglycan-binding domain
MSKQNRAAKAQLDKKVWPRFKQTVVEAWADDPAGLAQQPGGLIATAAVGTLQAQAARLGDARLQTVQRQTLAAQIGRVQGNQHLQKVVACLKRDERGADPKPAHRQLVGNQAVQWLAWPAAAQAQQAITQLILSPRRSLYTPFVQKQDAEVTYKFTEQEAIPIVAGKLSEAEIQLALKYNKAQGYSTALIKMIQRTVGTKDDGILGPNTVQAIARWQTQKGLYPDGKVGPKTLATISKERREEPTREIGKGQEPSSKERPGKEKTYIVKKSGVIVTPAIQKVLDELEPHFSEAKVRVFVTSAVRTPERQLGIIIEMAKKYSLHRKYPSILSATVDDIESWRGAWDELLNVKRFIVNPPKPATCKLAPNKGRTIGVSPHVPPKKAFDLAGAPLGTIQAIVNACKKEHPGTIGQVKPEPENGCVHVGVK